QGDKPAHARSTDTTRSHPSTPLVWVTNDMDSPCSFGIVCARLRIADHSITKRGSRDGDYTTWAGHREAVVAGAWSRRTGAHSGGGQPDRAGHPGPRPAR